MKKSGGIRKNRPERVKAVIKTTAEKPVIGTSPPRYAPREEIPLAPSLTVLPVDPRRIFAHWELKKTRYKKAAIRITEIPFKTGRRKTVPHFNIVKVPLITGSAYIKASPGKNYIFQAGHTSPGGRFVATGKPVRVSTARLKPRVGKSALPDKYFEFPQPEGSK